MLEDRKVNVKAKLALLWVALMFFYIYTERSLILKTKRQIGALAAQGEAVETRKSPSEPVSTQ